VILLRLYLLVGLVAHKAVWEALKRRPERRQPSPPAPLSVRIVKAAKVAILLGIVLQTVVPTTLPIVPDASSSATTIRALGVILYTAGLALAIGSRLQLGSNWSDIETARVLDRQVVVERGVYGLIRHPIYVGDILLLWGLELALNSWLVVGVALLTPVVLAQAIREEKMLEQTLPGYAEYCARTKRFIPYVV
jgi:protein-S-isoprenylcysteine O-methyltransferase Ste14